MTGLPDSHYIKLGKFYERIMIGETESWMDGGYHVNFWVPAWAVEPLVKKFGPTGLGQIAQDLLVGTLGPKSEKELEGLAKAEIARRLSDMEHLRFR